MSKTIRKIFLVVMIFTIMLIGMSTVIRAEDTDDTSNENTGFTLSDSAINVVLNGTEKILANKLNGETVTWTSSDETIATVEDGIVSGLKIGTTTITATTSGGKTATCEVTVVYQELVIKASTGSILSLNLVLEEYPIETLKAEAKDKKNENVENVAVTWKSSNPSVATIDNNGKVTAVGVGKVTITAEAAGVSDTFEITVVAAPKFTDFSNAKYEMLFDTDVDLKITGIDPVENGNYYYIITPNNTKPEISITPYGALDTQNTAGIAKLISNTNEKYIYANNLNKYVELNQDLYLWVIEYVNIGASYTENGENFIHISTKFVVEGQKLTRPQLPQLNLILKSLSIWGGKKEGAENTNISFRFPSTVKNRKFKLKIGKVTDNSILQKIQKNDYSGIIELLEYAKNNEAIYTENLTTTRQDYFSSQQALFDGVKLLDDNAYYYIYAKFDDENGKYYPIEGITLGQAWINDTKEYWDLIAYTKEEFKWNNLSSSSTEGAENAGDEEKDDTIAKDNLPDTGVRMIVIISIIALTGTVVFFKIKNDKYKEI